MNDSGEKLLAGHQPACKFSKIPAFSTGRIGTFSNAANYLLDQLITRRKIRFKSKSRLLLKPTLY